jgi:lipopolysaccharide transport system permease protein
MSGRSQHVTRIEPPRRWSVPSVREVFASRELLSILAWRDVKVRYKQTALGAAWAVLQPLLTMVVFTLIFGRFAKIPSDGVPYALFALAGLVPWTFFTNALLIGGNSLVADVSLVTKVYFPRVLVPLAAVLAGLLDLAIAFAILVATSFVYGRTPPARVVVVPLLVLLLVMSALGVTLFLSALNVRYRDVRYIVPFLTQLWLFATPVAYSTTLLDSRWRNVAAINPMTGVVQGFRWAVLGTNIEVVPLLVVSTLAACLMMMIGLAYFGAVEKTFADLV